MLTNGIVSFEQPEPGVCSGMGIIFKGRIFAILIFTYLISVGENVSKEEFVPQVANYFLSVWKGFVI